MNEFPPARQRGMVIQTVLAIVFSLVSAFSLTIVLQTQVGLNFSLYVLLFIIAAIPVPIFSYRVYALLRANYFLDRNTLRLVWGLRVEDIPVTDVEWIRPASGLTTPINLPLFRLPGGILGVTRQRDIGRVEFMASDAQNLILVATARQIYGISPEDPAAFLAAFQKTIEMGSLQPTRGSSQYPSFVVVQAWDSSLVRFLWMAGAFLNVGLLVWVTVLIPSLTRITLGFSSTGAPMAPVTGAQLILLPLLSAFLFVIGLITGLFFFRKPELRVLAVALWISGAFSGLFFLAAVFFILNTPI